MIDSILSACLTEGQRTEAVLIPSDLVMILDEAQYTYSSMELWYGVIKAVSMLEEVVRFVFSVRIVVP